MRLPHISPFDKNPIYFFTACTAGRQRVLASQFAFDLLNGIWRRSAALDGWYVGRFVLMPDHVHLFATPAPSAKDRELWIKMWKSVSARGLAKFANANVPIWQNDTFDHILRGKESYAEKWEYVRQNPVRGGLCARPEQWLWRSEIHTLSFR